MNAKQEADIQAFGLAVLICSAILFVFLFASGVIKV